MAAVLGALALATGSLSGLSETAQAATLLPCDIYGNAGTLSYLFN